MALAYTAPTWTDGSGQGITAAQLQALCNCVEGLVQGTDKALHNIAISGSTITLTFADGSVQTATTTIKSISNIAKTSTSGLVDTYTITMSDGTTTTFTVTNGNPGGGDMYAADYDADDTVKDAGGIDNYVREQLDEWTEEATATTSGTDTVVTFTGLDDSLAYDIYCDAINTSAEVKSKTGSGTNVTLVYKLTGSNVLVGTTKCKLRIIK